MGVLAKAIGIDPATMSRLVAGTKDYPVIRRKVDIFLGEALLTPADEFSRWNILKEAIGIDPVTSTMATLRQRAVELGIEKPGKLTRELLITKMVGAAASKTKAESEGKSPRAKTLGAIAVALGPIPGLPTGYNPRRSAAKGQSVKIHNKRNPPNQ